MLLRRRATAYTKASLFLLLAVYTLLQLHGEESGNPVASVDLAQLEELASGGEAGAVFFLETDDARTDFDHMVACCVEAAARHNPDRNVVVVAGADSKMDTYPTWLERENLFLVKVNLTEVAMGTPVEFLWTSGEIDRGPIYVKDRSNTARAALVSRLGGAYLDSDILSLDRLPDNWTDVVADQGGCTINNAFFSFRRGHPFLREILKELGPDLWSRVVKREYHRLGLTAKSTEACLWDKYELPMLDYAVLPRVATHPLSTSKSLQFFQEVDAVAADAAAVFPSSSVVHLRNTFLRAKRNFAPTLTEKTLYFRLAERNCPTTAEKMLRPMLDKTVEFDLTKGLGYNKKVF